MMTKVYLCARYGRREEMQVLAARMRAMGLVVTARWVEGNNADADAAQMDWDDLRAADMLFTFTERQDDPAWNPSWGRGGRHVEFGMAVERRMRIVIVGPVENVFHNLPGLARFSDVEAALDYVVGLPVH